MQLEEKFPEEVLKATGKEPFKGVYAYDNYEYIQRGGSDRPYIKRSDKK